MESIKRLISLENLKQFWSNVKSWFQPKLDRLDRKIWMGKESELESAIEAGLIDETTTIVITDGESASNIYAFCTESDIRALFPQYL